MRWPDVAKGGCIVLVVLWHVVLKHYQQIDWGRSLPFPAAWGVVGDQLLPLRMPLFFTVSGLFAAGAVRRSWPELLHSRIGRFGALYVVWVLVHTVVLAATPRFPTAHAADPLQLLKQLTISPTNLWYLLALALYFVVAKAAARVPTAWLLGGALLLSAVASSGLLPNENNRWQVLQNLVFFLAALRMAPLVHRLATAAAPRRAALLIAVSVAATGGTAILGVQDWFGVRPLVSLLAAAAGVVLAAAIARRLRRTGAALEWLGERTLPIYVLHLPVLALLDLALTGPLRPLEPRGVVLSATEPVLLTAATIGLSLLVVRTLRRLGLGRLFDPLGPLGPLGRRTSRGPDPASVHHASREPRQVRDPRPEDTTPGTVGVRSSR